MRLAVSRSTSIRRLTNFRSIFPRSILLLFLSPFSYFFPAFFTKSQSQEFVVPPFPPWETSSLRSRDAQSKSSLYPFLYKLESDTHSRNRRVRIAPELDKYYFEVTLIIAYHLRLSSLYDPQYFLSFTLQRRGLRRNVFSQSPV